MSWLRLDDGFALNPKIVQLSDREFRVWMRVLCYCSRHDDPTVDRFTSGAVVGLTPKTMRRFCELELLDAHGSSFEVHDWLDYRPKDATGAERQSRWRVRKTVTPTVTKTVSPVPVPEPDLDQELSRRTNLGNLEADLEEAILRLLAALTDKRDDTEKRIRVNIRKYRLAQGDVYAALEASRGPGVSSPAAVAVSELKKRGELKNAARDALKRRIPA